MLGSRYVKGVFKYLFTARKLKSLPLYREVPLPCSSYIVFILKHLKTTLTTDQWSRVRLRCKFDTRDYRSVYCKWDSYDYKSRD
jgi:hypothetical protein